MDTLVIRELCMKDKIINGIFMGVYPSDRLPKVISVPSCLIANTKPHNHPGEHWVAIYINRNAEATYYCSYGAPPQESILKWLETNTVKWERTRRRIQSDKSTTCGQYCVFFLHFACRIVTNPEIYDLFTNNYCENDLIVTGFINGFYDTNTVVRDSRFFE
jgi:hypothetical protein